jgi:hypothetical protein
MDELMNFDDETMFIALMEEEAKISIADDEKHLTMLSCLMALYARTDAKPTAEGRRLATARARRGRGWKATVFSMLTTSPTTHCTARWYFGVVFG